MSEKTVTREDLIAALSIFESKYVPVITNMIDGYPDVVDTLIEAKDNKGEPLFDAENIDSVLLNCKKTIERHPHRITAVLNNPQEIEMICEFKSRGAGLWRAVGDPLNSTLAQNPDFYEEQNTDYLALKLKEVKKKLKEHDLEMGKTGDSSIGKVAMKDYHTAIVQTMAAKDIMLKRHKEKELK